MDEAKLTTLLVGTLVLISLPYLWRNRSQFHSLFVFFTCYCVFVLTGLILMPWCRHVLGGVVFVGRHLFVDLGTEMNMSLFDSADYAKALMIVSVGLIATASGYIAAKFSQSTSRNVQRIPSNQVWDSSQISGNSYGFDRARCFYLTVTVILIVFVLIVSRGSAILNGLRHGFLAGSHEAVIQARFAISSHNYLTYVLACNVLSFFAVATWIIDSRSSQFKRRIWARSVVLITTLFQIFLFQKRPAIVFLCMIIAATFLLNHPKSCKVSERKKWLTLGFSGLVVTSFLMGLYYLSTSVRDVAENWFEAIAALFLISFTRVVGRLSVPAVWYAHYFPKVEQHYGVSNVSSFAKIFDFDFYPDTAVVYYYVTGNPVGSGAVCAIVDFYGGFGWFGCVIGGSFIGGLLAFIDLKLRYSKMNDAKILFIITTSVFVYYLSQSSVFRASLGYGGLYFLISWWLLGARLRCELKPVSHAGTATRMAKGTQHFQDII